MPTPRKSPARPLTPTRQSRRLRGEAPAPLDFSAESGEQPAGAERKDEPQEERRAAEVLRSAPKKEALEDRFFKLKEMENFLDEQDRNPNVSHGLLTEFDDDVGDADYKYDEFFGSGAPKRAEESDEEEAELPPVPLDRASTSTAEEAEEQAALIEEVTVEQRVEVVVQEPADESSGQSAEEAEEAAIELPADRAKESAEDETTTQTDSELAAEPTAVETTMETAVEQSTVQTAESVEDELTVQTAIEKSMEQEDEETAEFTAEEPEEQPQKEAQDVPTEETALEPPTDQQGEQQTEEPVEEATTRVKRPAGSPAKAPSPPKRVRFSMDAKQKRELAADAKKIEAELENLPPLELGSDESDFEVPEGDTLLDDEDEEQEDEEKMDVDDEQRDEEEDEEEMEEGELPEQDDQPEDGEEHPEEEEEEETTFSKQQKNLRSTIAQLEQQNLAPRSWELAGEVAAAEREPDGLLGQYLDVDYRATQPPVITEDVNARIEAIVRQRIKDKNFDDVIRVKRVDESLQTFRARTNIDEIERKSLMEMYEKQYAEKAKAVRQVADDDEEADEQLDAESAAVQAEMRAVFDRLDELSHANLRPAEAVGEPQVIVNKLAVHLEEVGQKASAAPDEELLAPEEVARHQRAAPKSAEERDRTDKNRERRKKKKKQKILVQRGVKKEGEYKAAAQLEERAPEKKLKKRKTKVIKQNGLSLKLDKRDFYAQLQATNEREAAEKTTKAKKLKRERSAGLKSGAQYKL